MNLIRRQIDRRLDKMRNLCPFETPSRGWVRTLREALGMTRSQLAKKLNISAQTIEKLERSESQESISLKSLNNIAKALDCQLVYALVPRYSIDEMVTKKMIEKAEKIVSRTRHSMRLEEQETSSDELSEQIQEIVMDFKKRKNISIIWDDEA